MTIPTSTLRHSIAAFLLALAGLATAQPVDCRISSCARDAPANQCNPEVVDSLNKRCDEWNAGVSGGFLPGMLPSGERTPKPMGAAQLRNRVRQFNACVSKNTTAKVPKPQAIEICKDRFDY